MHVISCHSSANDVLTNMICCLGSHLALPTFKVRRFSESRAAAVAGTAGKEPWRERGKRGLHLLPYHHPCTFASQLDSMQLYRYLNRIDQHVPQMEEEKVGLPERKQYSSNIGWYWATSGCCFRLIPSRRDPDSAADSSPSLAHALGALTSPTFPMAIF